MVNIHQTEKLTSIAQIIEQQVSKEEVLLRVEDCYLSYEQVVVQIEQKQTCTHDPFTQVVLEALHIRTPITVQQLADLFCADRALIYKVIQQLQQTHRIQMAANDVINSLQEMGVAYEVQQKTCIINSQKKKVVHFEPDYTVPLQKIVKQSVDLTQEDLTQLFLEIEGQEIKDWFSYPVAGPRMYKATIYNENEMLQRVVLYDEEGQLLYEMHREQVDLTAKLIERQSPRSVVSEAHIVKQLYNEESWSIVLKERIAEELISFLEQVKTPVLVVANEHVLSVQTKRFDLLEKSSKGLVTIIKMAHSFGDFYINEQQVFQKLSNDHFSLYEDGRFIQIRQRQLQSALLEFAKQFDKVDALKTFVYLVEQKIEEALLQSIFEEVSLTWSSDELMHRGKILDNHGYKKLAKAVYDLGIKAHAQEVNLS